MGAFPPRGAWRSLPPVALGSGEQDSAPHCRAHHRSPLSGRGALRDAVFPSSEGVADRGASCGEPGFRGVPGAPWSGPAQVRRRASPPNSSLLWSHFLFGPQVPCSSLSPFPFSPFDRLPCSPTSPRARAPQIVAPDRSGHGRTARVRACNHGRGRAARRAQAEAEDLHFQEKGSTDGFFWSLWLQELLHGTVCLEQGLVSRFSGGALASPVMFWGQAGLCPLPLLFSTKRLFLREVSGLHE